MPQQKQPTHGASALVRAALSIVLGVVALVVTLLVGPTALAPLVGWDVAAVTYVGWYWLSIRRLDAAQTEQSAVRDDPGRAGADFALLGSAVASLGAVAVVIVRAGNGTGVSKASQIALTILSVVLSWAVVHVTYTLRYARLYYAGTDGGVDFNTDEKPCYTDFAYLAFTIGMTFQVSDTPLKSTQLRRTALRHALLSYLFGTIIIATTINLVAGLSR